MVRKLLKYDLISILRIILPMQFILLGIAVFSKIIKIIPLENEVVTAIEIAVISSFYITTVVSAILTVVVIVVRFYKSLFTQEGYLNFTLPVSPMQQLASKLLMTILGSLITIISIFISFVVLYYEKNIISDTIKILLIVLNRLGEKMMVLEIFILLLFIMISTYLRIYACICLGQRATKHRIILAIGIYYGYEFVLQTLLMALLSITTFTGYVDEIFKFLSSISPHLIVVSAILFEIGMCAIYFAICHNSINKHLNLE